MCARWACVVFVVELLLRWEIGRRTLVKGYAEKLVELEEVCNGMEDERLHYVRPVREEDVEARVRFYLGDLWYECARDGGECPPEDEIEETLRELGPAIDEFTFDRIQRFSAADPARHPPDGVLKRVLLDKRSKYNLDLLELIEGAGGLEDVDFYVKFGDASGPAPHAFPFLGKARRQGGGPPGTEPILMKMLRTRHFRLLTSAENGIPFSRRKDAAVWRGGTTGHRMAYLGAAEKQQQEGAGATLVSAPAGQPAIRTTGPPKMHPRASLVTRMSEWEQSGGLIDVGVTEYVQNIPPLWGWKLRISMQGMASYKMIIQAEGNDVSSGLKWSLLSGSAVVMPPPRIDSWAMESTLVPWVHYIPVDVDFGNLVERAQWCVDNPAQCEVIARQGACHMAKFLDEESDEHVVNQVLHRVANILAKYDSL